MVKGLNIRDTLSFSERLSLYAPKLSSAESTAADYIQNNTEEIIHSYIAEVAQKSQISEATIVRLCKKLGYGGFQQLKISLAQQPSTYQQPRHFIECIEKGDDIGTIKKKIFQSNLQALYDSMEICQDKELEKAVQIISDARSIEFYATGASAAVALDAQHKFLRVGIKSHVCIDALLQSMSASVMNKDDVVIAISHTGLNKDVIHAVKLAKEQGASIIALTGFSKSPITRLADIVLYTTAHETMFGMDAVSSRIAQLAIIHTLFAGVVNKNYDKLLENNKKTKSSIAYYNYFKPSGKK